MVIRIEQYNSSQKQAWDDFNAQAKNSHFFFNRDYMEYHADRFLDHSLLVYGDDKLVALLPANLSEGTLYSHQGLSFGGLLTDKSMKTSLMLEIFQALKLYLHEKSIDKLIYKAMPTLYHQSPAEEDLYALSVNDARLYRRDCSSTILLSSRVPYQERRRRAISKSKKQGLTVERSYDYKLYWKLLEEVLESKHSRKPVHNVLEMEYLANRFPDNIKLFVSKDSTSNVLAGTVVYENQNVVHAQYLANSELGKEKGALDLVIDSLLNHYYADKQYFDFGISTEMEGKVLNQGLIENKEGFGARATVQDFYELVV